MTTLKEKLDKELNNIRLAQKKENGLLLSENDIHTIFSILKEHDTELFPILRILESLLSTISEENYLLLESYITEIFKYYKLLENDDLIKCRHKFLFTENRVIKKSFFDESTSKKVKEKLEQNSIFKKL